MLKPRTVLLLTLAIAAALAAGPAPVRAEADGAKKVEALKASLLEQVKAAEGASEKVKSFVEKTLLPLCTDATFVKAVKAQNAKKLTLEQIKKTDKEWIEAEEPLPIHDAMLGNECAKRAVAVAKANPGILEIFVMDNQGANVGQNALTSDYWQGDEAKWKNSYKDGKGGVDVGDVEFDKSANAELQQVSLPIIDADGTVIGAVTYGLTLDRL